MEIQIRNKVFGSIDWTFPEDITEKFDNLDPILRKQVINQMKIQIEGFAIALMTARGSKRNTLALQTAIVRLLRESLNPEENEKVHQATGAAGEQSSHLSPTQQETKGGTSIFYAKLNFPIFFHTLYEDALYRHPPSQFSLEFLLDHLYNVTTFKQQS